MNVIKFVSFLGPRTLKLHVYLVLFEYVPFMLICIVHLRTFLLAHQLKQYESGASIQLSGRAVKVA